jgi:hypothetical protein
MPNQFSLAGANAGRQTKLAPIYTGRWSSGIWTNRSPLRDAATSRIVEKFYGAAGDALIAGLNVEITNRLTLARRPGNQVFTSQIFNNIDRFYDFRVFGPNTEQIIIMVDQANALYSLYNNQKTLVWTKSTGAGQSYMQSVGNILFFGNGVDNKKWLQTLVTWQPNEAWNTATTPYLSTYLIDTNGNIQQLTGTAILISDVTVNQDIVTITSTYDLTNVLAVGEEVTFPNNMVASFLDNLTATVTLVNGTTFTFNFVNANYPQAAENPGTYASVYPGDGTPTSGSSQPAWNITPPVSGNYFQGGLTYDGTAVWTNRGNPVENWGIAPPTKALTPEVDGSVVVWEADTFYSSVAVIRDSNGNLQQATNVGTSGAAVPKWNTVLNGITYDNGSSGVTWKMVASAALLVWKPDTFYPAGSFLINSTSGGSCLFQASYNTPSGGVSSGTQPTWPPWVLTDAPAYPSVTEITGLQWNNLGPIGDFVWYASTHYTLAGTTIVDINSNEQSPYRTGKTGSVEPTFATTLDALTPDPNPNLTWINLGPVSLPPVGTISTENGGWKYAISLVNTLDDTVSNATPVSAATGNFTGAYAVILTPGDGLDINNIDPQADYVAIWRTTDGQSQPFLIPGSNDFSLPITIPLSQYLQYGYTDTTPDTGLNNLIEAPILGENTPPGAGASNLAFYLNRIFYSIGNTVYWTSGPDTPAGNGLNGTNPLDFDEQISLVKRIVPTTNGAWVFTVSDINIIQGNGTTNSPIESAVPLIEGVGISSYNALDINGSIIGFFTTDNQFLIADPANGITTAGFPIGDQFRLNNGSPGQTWNPANVYVAWHVKGEDQAWYVCDGQYGWYRLISTPAPEQGGYTWSPFGQIVSGCQCVQSIETAPGVHNLLLAPVTSGQILARDVDSNTDGESTYSASAVLGSMVLSQPGQTAIVGFITTESVNVGTPLILGLIVDEALPYYQGSFEYLKNYKNDPPTLAPSQSILGQRFYLAEAEDFASMMRHMQVQVSWASEDAENELLSLTVFGGFLQED